MNLDLEFLPGLSEVQVRALEALTSCFDEAKVAETVGVSRSTMWRWLNRDKTFANAWRTIRTRRVEQALSLMQMLSVKAAGTLGKLLECEQPQARLLAARSIMEWAGEAVKTFDVTRRLVEVEEKVLDQELLKKDKGHNKNRHELEHWGIITSEGDEPTE